MKYDLVADRAGKRSRRVLRVPEPRRRAVKVAKALVQHGFRRVRPLHGGIDAWIAAGLGSGALTSCACEPRVVEFRLVAIDGRRS